jgi:hypothetical protein
VENAKREAEKRKVCGGLAGGNLLEVELLRLLPGELGAAEVTTGSRLGEDGLLQLEVADQVSGLRGASMSARQGHASCLGALTFRLKLFRIICTSSSSLFELVPYESTNTESGSATPLRGARGCQPLYHS